MKSYQRLSHEEREEISRMLASCSSIREIGRVLGRSPSTISREINKSHTNRSVYRALKGNQTSKTRASSRKLGKRKLLSNSVLRKIVLKKLSLFWSPEQIASYTKITYEDRAMTISAEGIYSYIYVLPRGALRKELTDYLRRKHILRRKKSVTYKGQTSNLEDMISIDERPEEVADRTIPGHWEGDLIIGGSLKQTALGTLVERTTRNVILVPLKNKTATEVRKAFARELKNLPQKLKLTLTYDQGREMAEHKLFTKDTKMKVYFAHPKSPWERGRNENTNSLIRQFFPKDTDFTKVTRKEIKYAQKLLNERPRKTLGWRTPKEAMEELLR
jgi:IS30 family transposase